MKYQRSLNSNHPSHKQSKVEENIHVHEQKLQKKTMSSLDREEEREIRKQKISKQTFESKLGIDLR